MRSFVHAWCVMLSVAVLVSPIGHVHAHITGDDHHDIDHRIDIHGGHSHELVAHHHHDGAHDDTHTHEGEQGGSSGQVLDLRPDASQLNSTALSWMLWLAALCAFAIVIFRPPRLLQVVPPPPRIRTRPPSPYPHALPLLRGPPRSI